MHRGIISRHDLLFYASFDPYPGHITIEGFIFLYIELNVYNIGIPRNLECKHTQADTRAGSGRGVSEMVFAVCKTGIPDRTGSPFLFLQRF